MTIGLDARTRGAGLEAFLSSFSRLQVCVVCVWSGGSGEMVGQWDSRGQNTDVTLFSCFFACLFILRSLTI